MFSRIQREIDAMAGQFAFEIKFGFLIINIRKWNKHGCPAENEIKPISAANQDAT